MAYDAYRCAYRDPKSPLTPIPPMDTAAFTFGGLSTIKSLTPVNPQICQTLQKSPMTPKTVKTLQKSPLSVPFTKKQSNITNNNMASTALKTSKTITKTLFYEEMDGKVTIKKSYHETTTTCPSPRVVKPTQRRIPTNLLLNPDTCRCTRFKRCSPVPPKPLCPKLARVLTEIGLSKYLRLFEEQEIDYSVFKMMTEEDLYNIGIHKQIERDVILNAIYYWSDFY